MKKTHKKMDRLFLRFLVTYFIIILVPVLILGTFIYRYFFNYMRENLETSRYASLERLCSVHDNLISQIEVISNQIYLSDAFNRFYLPENPEKTLELISELNIFSQSNPYLTEIAFHFTDDTYVYTTTGSNTVEMFFEQILGNPEIYTEQFVSDLFDTQTPRILPMHHLSGIQRNGDAVVFCYPLPMHSTSHYATVLFYVSDDTYRELIGIQDTPSENTYVVKDDTVLFQTDTLAVSEKVLHDMLSNDSTFQYLEDDGSLYLAVHASQPYSGFSYYQLIDLNEVYAPLRRMQRLFLFLNAVILFVCGLLMYWFSRLNYNPLKQIIARLRPIPAAIPLDGNNELNRLLDGIDYVYHQNRQLNLEVEESIDAKRSVVLINFIKGRYLTRESMEPFCKGLNFHLEHSFYDIWLVQFHTGSDLSPIDDEATDIFSYADAQADIHATELLSSDTLAVVTFFQEKESRKQRADSILQKLSSLGFHGVIGISDIYTDFASASKAFLEASICLSRHNLSLEQELIFFDRLQTQEHNLDAYPYHLLEEFSRILAQQNLDKLHAFKKQMLTFVRTVSMPHFLTQGILREMANALIRHCQQAKISDLDLYKLYDNIQTVHSLQSFESCIEEIIEFSRELLQRTPQSEHVTAGDLLPVIQYINENCKSPDFSLYNVAEHFQMSPSQLTNAFKAELHVSPSAYITNYKIRIAKLLLETTEDSVADICASLGYSDTSSFIRKFRQQTGKTPAAYRKESQDS